jgi:hypothetical protein
MTSKLKTDVLETVSGSGTIALTNQLSGMTSASVPLLTNAHVPAGSVINAYTQVLPSTSIGTTSSSFVNTGLSITLTPVSASSKFYITYTSAPHLNTSSGTTYVTHFVHRNSTVTTIGGGERQDGSSGWRTATQTTQGIDAPNTASAITYTVKFLTGSAGNTGYFHVGNHLNASHAAGVSSQFTILEIKG